LTNRRLRKSARCSKADPIDSGMRNPKASHDPEILMKQGAKDAIIVDWLVTRLRSRRLVDLPSPRWVPGGPTPTDIRRYRFSTHPLANGI
jgi:hypothetical protein